MVGFSDILWVRIRRDDRFGRPPVTHGRSTITSNAGACEPQEFGSGVLGYETGFQARRRPAGTLQYQTFRFGFLGVPFGSVKRLDAGSDRTYVLGQREHLFRQAISQEAGL